MVTTKGEAFSHGELLTSRWPCRKIALSCRLFVLQPMPFFSRISMRTWRLPLLTLPFAFALTNFGMAQGQGKIDFQRDVRPILANHCFKCHGPAQQKSGVRLDSQE